jgi:tetratricopeptide (TPR) repeat protein
MNKKYVLTIPALVVLIFLVYFLVDKNIKNKNEFDNSPTSSTSEVKDASSTTVVDLGGGVKAIGTGSFKVEKIEDLPSQVVPKPIPNLSRVIVFDQNIDLQVKKIITDKVKELKDVVSNNPSSLPAWLDLGNYHKMAGDFKGAEIYWNYASLLSPNDFIAFSNLADLYGYYLKDISSAEKYYNLAIEKGKSQYFLYFKFAEFYRDVLKDKNKALSVVQKGLVALPGNKELESLQASLK